MRPKLALLILALVMLVGCDHATKHWAETSLKAAPHIEVVAGMLDLRYAANDDMAFSLLRHIPSTTKLPFFVLFGALGIAGVSLAWYRRRRNAWLEQSAYVLLLAGAVGNVADRVARGYVVDFIHVHHWPVFNVADALLVAGVVLLLFTTQRATSPPPISA
jgi:signal peptidase II